ncbi:MAG: hypothetical protein OEQ39_14580 [Gammaproteobacteria bacterium]|nr:hypothetical protein [Gammaproteobacteria bacterium]
MASAGASFGFIQPLAFTSSLGKVTHLWLLSFVDDFFAKTNLIKDLEPLQISTRFGTPSQKMTHDD